MPRALEALRLLAQNGYAALVLSNQECVDKGLLSSNELDAITRRFLLEVALSGGNIAQVYYCRHGAQDECDCRKPRMGLMERAQRDHGFVAETTFLVGESPGDLRMADEAGCPAILIRFLEDRSAREEPQMVACSLYEAAELILMAQRISSPEAIMATR